MFVKLGSIVVRAEDIKSIAFEEDGTATVELDGFGSRFAADSALSAALKAHFSEPRDASSSHPGIVVIS